MGEYADDLINDGIIKEAMDDMDESEVWSDYDYFEEI